MCRRRGERQAARARRLTYACDSARSISHTFGVLWYEEVEGGRSCKRKVRKGLFTMSGSGGATADTLDALLHQNILMRDGFDEMKREFLNYETLNSSPVSMSTDDVAEGVSVTYSPAADEFIPHSLESDINREGMADPQGAMESVNAKNPAIEQPRLPVQYTTGKAQITKFADDVVSLLNKMTRVGDADVQPAVQAFMENVLVHPPVASKMKVYGAMLDSMEGKLDESLRLAPNQVRMVESLFNYKIPGLLRGVGRDPSTGLVTYDRYGRPKFEAPIVIPNTPAQTVAQAQHMNVLVRGVPVELRSMERAEDVILANYMNNATHVGRVLRISLPTGGTFTHAQFISELQRELSTTLAEDDPKEYTVSVRFDIASEAGMSGLDAFAPHLVFSISKSMGRSKRPAEAPREGGVGGDGASGKPKKPKPTPNPSRKRAASVLTGALNGNDSIVNRPWNATLAEVEDDDSSESSSGVGPEGRSTPHVLLGDKVRPGQPRPAELLVEHHRKGALEAGRVQPLYMSSPPSQSVVDFGDVSTPVAMRSQVEDGADVGFHAQLMIDLRTANGLAAADPSPAAFGFTSIKDYKPAGGGARAGSADWWHALAYVTFVPSSDFEAGKVAASQSISAMYTSLTAQERMFLAAKDAFVVSDGRFSAATLLTPSEALAQAGNYAPGTYALPGTRFKGKLSDEVAQFAVRRPVWRMPDSWAKETVTLMRAGGRDRLRDDTPTWESQRGAILVSLATQIKGYSSKLEDEYVKAKRTLRSASYLRMCSEYIQDGVAIIGTGPMLGEVLAAVLMREAAFVAAYPARAETCASALCEAIQLFALVSGEAVPDESAEEWYVDMMRKVCSVTDDGTFDASSIDTGSFDRMKMQIDKGPNEEADAWSWLVGEGSVTDAIKKHLRSSTLDLLSKPDDLKSYDDLDSEIKRVLSIKEVVKGTTEKMRMAEYLGADVLASLLDGFDPVLFISLCHPDRVLQELPQPRIQTDEYEDDAYTPSYSGLSAVPAGGMGAAADADRRPVSDVANGTLPSSLKDVLNTAVRTYLATWTKALLDVSPISLGVHLNLLQAKALDKIKTVETMKTFVASIFNNTQGRRIWIHNFYDIVYGGNPFLPTRFDDVPNDDDAMMAKLATIAVMRPLLKATFLDPSAIQYDAKVTENLKKVADGALSIVNTLNKLESANQGVIDHVLRFFASLEPTRKAKFAQKAYPQGTIGRLVNPGLGIADVAQAKKLYLTLTNKTASMKQLDILSDLFGNMERVARSAPGTLAALFFDNGELGLRQQPGAALLLRYYEMRWSTANEDNHPRSSVVPYIKGSITLDEGSGAESSSAVTPQPAGGARLPIVRTRAPLLSVHNVMSEFAERAAQNSADVLPFESYSNSLPKHDVSADGDGEHEARLPASTPSTLLHRAATRRKLLDASRVNLNGSRAFNWVSTDVEHLRLVLDDSDSWGSAMRSEGKSKRILTMDYSGRKINESLIPEAVNLPYEPSAVDANPLNATAYEYDTVARRDLKRWSWILDFGAHDASYFGKATTFEQIVGSIGAMQPSRRVVSESDGSHVSLSILAKTSRSNGYESVSVNGVSESGQAVAEFSAGQLLSVKGANTLSDRLFLSNGFLDLKSLVDEYKAAYEENGKQTWLTPQQHSNVYGSGRPSNENSLPLRLSERAMERFTKLRTAHGVLANIHMRSKLDAGNNLDASSAKLMRTLHRPAGATSADLAEFEHLRFGSATKDSFSRESAVGAPPAALTFAQSIPVNQRFVNFSDVVESLKPGQPFRPYTFDDFAAHSVDVCERIHALTNKVRTPDGVYKVQGFASSQATIDMCSDLIAYVDSLLSACAIAKVMLMTLHSPNFARMHAYEPPNPALRKQQQWGVWTFPQSQTYDVDADASITGGETTKTTLKAILGEIDGTMAAYYAVGEQVVKLKVEASFLMRVGKELYKRASTNTCQRIVTDQLQTNYVPYSSSQFSAENFRPSESSDELQIAVKRTFSKSILSSSSRPISGGWGSMYTLGGQRDLQDALAGRGHLHPDARYDSKLKANPENIHWCSTSALHGCNYDFGIYGMYAAYLAEVDAAEEAYERVRYADAMDVEGDDDSATLSGVSVRPTRGTGTAFQYWGITTLLQDIEVLSSWKSVERLPTFAELVSEFGHLEASSPYRSHCFDGIETRFLPDMQRKGELIRVATNRFASWLTSAPFRPQATARKPLFLSEVFDVKESYGLSDRQLIETGIMPHERKMVKEFALVMESIPPRLWNSWKMLSSETMFLKNRRIESASREWQDLSSMLYEDDADVGDREAEEIILTGDGADGGEAGEGREGGDVQRPGTVEGLAEPPPDAPEADSDGGDAMDADDQLDVIARSLQASRDRAAREETRRQLQSERQEVDTCPERLVSGDYTVIETPEDGNCLYTSIAKLMNRRRVLDANGDSFDADSLRVMAATFFMTDSANLSLDMRQLYFPLYESIRMDLASFGTAASAANMLFEIAYAHPDMVSLAQGPDTPEARQRLMQRYGDVVATTDPPTWANAPEMEVLASLLSVKLCVYTPGSSSRTTLERGTSINPQATVELPLLWTNPEGTALGTRAHYEALVVYVPLPEVAAPMQIGSFLKRKSPYEGATFECVFEAVATAMKQYGHPQAKTAAEMRSDFASWVRAGLRSKNMPVKEREALKAAANGGVAPSRDIEFTLNETQLQCLPYAIRSNLAVYNSLDAEGASAVLVEAHAPFSCAHSLKLIRLPSKEGAAHGPAHVYGIA